MPTGLRRHYGQGDLHFVTFCCYHRRRHLQTARVRNLFLKVLAEVRVKYDFRLVGYVVMPDHVHLLISEPKKREYIEGAAGFEATSIAQDARKEERSVEETTAAEFRRDMGDRQAILAAAFLRFQCMEP